MATTRPKKTHGENSGALGLLATKPMTRLQARSQQKGGDGDKCVPGPLLEPVIPGKQRPTRLRRGGERGRPVPASLCPGENEEPVHPGVFPAQGGGQPRAEALGAPLRPLSQPCYEGVYFSGLPEDKCQDPPVPSLTRRTLDYILVLELEGILVCSSLLAGQLPGATASFTTSFQSNTYKVDVQLRPHVQQFLESLSKTYEIFIYTTAKNYAKKIIDVLDPKRKFIRRCLFQQDCFCAQGCYWKDLNILGRDLAKTVALDYTMQGFPSQAANWITVPRWFGDPGDEELLRLIPLLEQLCKVDDVRTEVQKRFPRCKLPTKD